MKKMSAFVAVALSLLCAKGVHARVTCTNTWEVGTFVSVTTFESSAPTLTFLDPGIDPATHDCVGGDPDCTTLPCLQAGCSDIPFNTRNCLLYLVSQCGTAPPVIRQVNFLSAGACP